MSIKLIITFKGKVYINFNKYFYFNNQNYCQNTQTFALRKQVEMYT